MVLFRRTENEPSKMHNVRPYVYSRPWHTVNSCYSKYTCFHCKGKHHISICDKKRYDGESLNRNVDHTIMVQTQNNTYIHNI